MKLFRIILGVYLTFLAVMFLRCGKVTELNELIKQTDKIQIIFENDKTNYFEITEKNIIHNFDKYIGEEETALLNCAYDGRILFFTEQGSVEMNFILQDDCQRIEYTYAGETHRKKLSEEGLFYLKSFQK